MSERPTRSWLTWAWLMALFVGVAGAVALVGSIGASAWATSGGLLSPERRVAKHCAAAVRNAVLFGDEAPVPTAEMERDCQLDFLTMGDEVSLASLACQAEAETADDWRSCYPARDDTVGEEATETKRPTPTAVRLDLGEPDRELAEAAGVLGQLDLEGAFATDSLGGGLGSGRGSGSLGSPGAQQSTGGLGSTQPTSTEPASTGVRGTGKGSSAGGGATVSMGDGPVIVGPLDRSLVDAAIERIMNQIRYCYLRELTKHPELGGRIVVEIEIAEDGTVSSATTKTSTVNNKAVEGCVNGRFLRLAFPTPEGGSTVVVTYPFEFQPG